MKKNKKWLMLSLVVVLLIALHLVLRPRAQISLNGTVLSNENVMIIVNGVGEKSQLDEDGMVYFDYSDVGKHLIVNPVNLRTSTKSIGGTHKELELGKNELKITEYDTDMGLTSEFNNEDKELIKNMEQLRLGRYRFDVETSVEDILKTLVLRLRESDPSSKAASILNSWLINLPNEIKTKKTDEFGFESLSLAEVLDVVLMRTGHTWRVLDGELVLEKVNRSEHPFTREKLEGIRLDVVDFEKEATLRDGINFMRSRARELDGELEPEKKGVSFIFRNTSVRDTTTMMGDEVPMKDALSDRVIGELRMRNVSMKELLTIICRRGGVTWHVGKHAIIFKNK